MKTEAVATRDTLATAHVINIRPLMRPDDRTDTIADRDVQARPKLELVRELQHQRGARRATVGEQQSLALEFTSPTPFVPVIIETELQTRDKPRSPASWMPEVLEDSFFEPQPTSRAELPEPAQWARQYGQAWLEASLGRRPIKQLNRWSSPGVLAELTSSTKPATSKNGRSVAPRSQRTRQEHAVVSGMRIDEPADGVAEVAAVVRTRGRCRALMLRLEGWDGRWVCTYAALV